MVSKQKRKYPASCDFLLLRCFYDFNLLTTNLLNTDIILFLQFLLFLALDFVNGSFLSNFQQSNLGT